MFAICELNTSNRYKKTWLPSDQKYAMIMMGIEERNRLEFWETKYKWSNVKMLDRIDNQEFDKLMSECIVFLDLYDSSANNAVVESIARNTPILINKIPAVIEYLGVDYPLYFDTYDQAVKKLADDNLIMKAHFYLKHMDKRWISGSYFAKDVNNKLEAVL